MKMTAGWLYKFVKDKNKLNYQVQQRKFIFSCYTIQGNVFKFCVLWISPENIKTF